MLAGSYLTSNYLAGGPTQVAAQATEFWITVGGVRRDGLLRHSSFSLDDQLESRSTCVFSLFDRANTITIQVGEQVEVRDQAATIFAGTVESVRDHYPSYDSSDVEHFIEVSCVDYTQLADRHQVAALYDTTSSTNGGLWTAGDIVQDILTNYLVQDGVSTGLIQDGGDVGKVVFNYVSATEALDELAKPFGFTWAIDFQKQLNFFASGTRLAPWTITDSSQNHMTMIRERTREQYRNVQRIRGGKDVTASTRQQTFAGDGENRTFTLELPVAREPTIERSNTAGGWDAQTVGIQEVETGYDFYWQKGSNTITQDDEDTPLADTDTLRVTYFGFFNVFVEVTRQGEIDERALVEATSGIYEAIESDANLDAETLVAGNVTQFAVQKAQGILREKARIPIFAEIQTTEPGIIAGQTQRITLTREGIDGDFLVVSASVSDRGHGELLYNYRVVDGERFESPYRFFQKLAAAGRSVVINENEVLFLVRELQSGLGYSDADGTSTGDSLISFLNDPYTVLLIGEGVVGREYTDAGETVGRSGFRVGAVTNP